MAAFDFAGGNLGFGSNGASYAPNNSTYTAPSWTGGNPFLGGQNPYLQSTIDSTMGDMARNYNLMVKPNTESSMVASGSFGNSGLQQMQQNQQQNLMDSMGKTAAQMRMQDYGNQANMYQWDQGFNRNLYNDAFDQNMQQATLARGLLNDANTWNQVDIQNATNLQNTPLDYLGKFSNIANGIGSGFGTTTQNMSGNPLLGGIAGWGLGTQIARGL